MKLSFGKRKTVQAHSEDSSPVDFVDLAPVDNADEDGHYAKALNFALHSDRIKNIALTGPFGSGKSSIIKTFEKNCKGTRLIYV